MNSKTLIAIIIVVLVIAAGLFLLNRNQAAAPSSTSVAPSQTAQQPTTSQPTTAASNTAQQNITIEGNEFAFTPAAITLKKGQPVSITFKNTGQYPHNLAISDLNIETKTIQSGEQDTIQFTPAQTGQFTYICTVPGHADKGMKGTLTIE